MSIHKLSFAVAVLAILATQALAQTCGEICTAEFWGTATPDEITTAIENVDVTARDLREGGGLPLHWVAGRGTAEHVITLIDAGADVNARSSENGLAALHAARSRDTAIALVEAGAEVNARSESGRTPLHYASRASRTEIVVALAELGADVNARDENGDTPLHYAARYATPETITILLDAGADGASRNKNGETPWELAQSNEDLKGTNAYWRLNDARFNVPTREPQHSAARPLTGAEQDAFRTSVQVCWVVDQGSLASSVTVTLAFELTRDGRVLNNEVIMIRNSGGSPGAVQEAYEAARRAVLRCQSDGFPLPVDKYEQWRMVEMTFNPAEMRIR